MQEAIKKFALPHTDLSAQLRLWRKGQQEIHVGDGVIVKAEIHLPTTNARYLPPCLQFGRRVQIDAQPLIADWGHESLNGTTTTRVSEQTFTAFTWKEAFELADAWGTTEIEKLIQALSKRKQALLDAEQELF